MFVGVQRGFQAVRNVLIFDLDGEYIPVGFIIILHTTCLYFMHVCINFHSLKQKKKTVLYCGVYNSELKCMTTRENMSGQGNNVL